MIIDLIVLLLAVFSTSILAIEKWDLIKTTWKRFKMLFTVYILWSKEERIRASEISKKYQLTSGLWIKDESKIKMVETSRRRLSR